MLEKWDISIVSKSISFSCICEEKSTKYLYVSSCVFPCGNFSVVFVNKRKSSSQKKDSVHLGVRPFYKLCTFVVRRLYFQTAKNRENHYFSSISRWVNQIASFNDGWLFIFLFSIHLVVSSPCIQY